MSKDEDTKTIKSIDNLSDKELKKKKKKDESNQKKEKKKLESEEKKKKKLEDKEKKAKEKKEKEKKNPINKDNNKENDKDTNQNKIEKGKEKQKSIFNIILKITLVITIICSLFSIYELSLLNSIETTIRYIAMGIIIFIDCIFAFKVFCKKKSKNRNIGTFIFMILFSIIYILLGVCISYVYSKLDSINKDIVTYSSSLITMYDNKASNIKEIKNYKIGILDDKESPDGYIIPQEIISDNNLNDENQLIKYSDYPSMIADLYADEIDAVFITSSYPILFSSLGGYESIKEDTKIIITKEKEMKKADVSEKEIASIHKSVTDPFTVLLMGIDSTADVLSKNAVANGDTLILVTFNPKTLNATMVSIPRDSYVPIACWPRKDENKITHAAAYGNDCMMNTIEDFFGINIDYYAKINFKGLVKLVDAVGGVEVDVPKTLCTDNSNRDGVICIEPGLQTLNGEQALVFARNRKGLVDGDFGRGQHQQQIVMALVNKMKTITEARKFKEILDTVSNSLDTNFTTKQILEFYNVAKDIIKNSLASDRADLINIQQLYLSGSSQMIYDERMRRVLYNYVPNTHSKNDIIKVMKQNLELESHNNIFKFDFSINDPYVKQIIGKGPYVPYGLYNLLPSFIGMSKEQAEREADRLGLNYKIEGIDGNVVTQSYPARKRLDKINDKLILTLSKQKEDEEEKEDEKKEDENLGEDTEVSPEPSESPSPKPTDKPNPSPSDTPNTKPESSNTPTPEITETPSES